MLIEASKQPRMVFSGQTLADLHGIIGMAISEVQMQIGSCPDVNHFADDIEDLEEEKEKLKKLQARIAKKFPAGFFEEAK